MSLAGSLNIGRTALSASQVGIQVTGNNFANASTPGYSRQRVNLSALSPQRWGTFQLGRGVGIDGIQRQIDQSIIDRLNGAIGRQGAAQTSQNFLSQLESVVNDLGDNALSREFDRFYDAWSDLAKSPNADGARSLVITQGSTLAAAIRATRTDIASAQRQIESQLGAASTQADSLLTQIANLNQQISVSESGGGEAGSLRDQRDQAIQQLAGLVDITTVEQPNGSVDVLVGSTPLVQGTRSRGIVLERKAVNATTTEVTVRIRADNTEVPVTGGVIGGLISQRDGVAKKTIENLDTVASKLIFEVNKLHSTGYSGAGLTEAVGTLVVPAADTTRALNDPLNATFGGLPFKAVNGGFLVTVKNTTTGASETVRVNVDLDGITNAGTPGTADDSSVASIAASLNGVSNLTASVNPDGTLKIGAASGYTFSFSEDSSGALAVMGVNSYFSGKDGTDIDVRASLKAQPRLLSIGRTVGGNPSDNGTALALAGLRDQTFDSLGGATISGAWVEASLNIGAQNAEAASRADAATLVRENLDSQRAAISGVSLDEESINLLNYQRMYQGAARFISVVDELTQTLLAMAQ
jgi:flagellar hook-associated protein 1 FlgK